MKIIIDAVIEDNDISYGDITILSSNINNNAVFDKLTILLKKNNMPSVLFKTKTQDGNVTIDMNKAKEKYCSKCQKKFNKKSNNCKKCGTLRKRDKITLISGHGFKGGESKCVIAFGISEMAIPKPNHPDTPNELNDISLFNVLHSRSKKYLFIGSNSNPSRYITNNIEKLSDVLYLVQNFSRYLNEKYLNEKTKKNII